MVDLQFCSKPVSKRKSEIRQDVENVKIYHNHASSSNTNKSRIYNEYITVSVHLPKKCSLFDKKKYIEIFKKYMHFSENYDYIESVPTLVLSSLNFPLKPIKPSWLRGVLETRIINKLVYRNFHRPLCTMCIQQDLFLATLGRTLFDFPKLLA